MRRARRPDVWDGMALTGTAAVLVVAYHTWLSSYRGPRAAPYGRSFWFRAPPWAQLAAGIASTLAGARVVCRLWRPLPVRPPVPATTVLRAMGAVLIAAGATLAAWGRLALGGMAGVSTGSAVQLRAHHRLVQHGPYRLTRHPMYAGYLLYLAGLFLAYRTWAALLLVAMFGATFQRRAHQEDRALEATFGDAWRQYAARVAPWLHAFPPRRPTTPLSRRAH